MILPGKASDEACDSKITKHSVVTPQPKNYNSYPDEDVGRLEEHVEIIQDILPFLPRNQHLAALIVV